MDKLNIITKLSELMSKETEHPTSQGLRILLKVKSNADALWLRNKSKNLLSQ